MVMMCCCVAVASGSVFSPSTPSSASAAMSDVSLWGSDSSVSMDHHPEDQAMTRQVDRCPVPALGLSSQGPDSSIPPWLEQVRIREKRERERRVIPRQMDGVSNTCFRLVSTGLLVLCNMSCAVCSKGTALH